MRVKYWLAFSSAMIVQLSVLPLVLAQTPHDSLPPHSAGHGIQGCIPGTAAEERQRCDEAISNQLKASSKVAVLDGGWRLVKTTDPGSTNETVSAMRTVDTARSDINLAGLSLRCAPGGMQVVLILLSSFPRTSQPRVTLTAGANRSEFDAAVAPGGGALLLPQAAAGLASGDWQNASELSIEIATNSNPIRGIVPIAGLSSALRSLSANCAGK